MVNSLQWVNTFLAYQSQMLINHNQIWENNRLSMERQNKEESVAKPGFRLWMARSKNKIESKIKLKKY